MSGPDIGQEQGVPCRKEVGPGLRIDQKKLEGHILCGFRKHYAGQAKHTEAWSPDFNSRPLNFCRSRGFPSKSSVLRRDLPLSFGERCGWSLI